MARHIASAHSNKKYECTLCEKSFQRKDCLQRHRLTVHDKTIELRCSKCEKAFARTENFRRHQKNCCRCKQCSKQFKNISSLKKHNCSKTEEVSNLSPDIETNFTNLDILKAVSRNEQATSNGFEADSTRNEQTSPSRDGVEAGSTRNEQTLASRDGVEAVSTRNEQTSPSRDGVEAGSTGNEQATSSKVNKQNKRKSLKIKRCAHQIEDEAAVPVECLAAKKKSKHQIMQEEEIEASYINLKEFIKKYWWSI